MKGVIAEVPLTVRTRRPPMERRRALAIAGALTATLLTGTVAAGAVGGFFGFTSTESGATPGTTDPPPSSRPVVTVHVPGPAPDDATTTPSGASTRIASRAGVDAAGPSVPPPVVAAAPPAAPSPALEDDDAAEPVDEDEPAASPGEREDEHEEESEDEPDDGEHEVDD
jgi:hypothetical protein